MTPDQARKRLAEKVDKYRTKGEAATHLGISSPALSDMLHDRRPLTEDVLKALGLERVTLYQEKANA